jgi:hypothetical protein
MRHPVKTTRQARVAFKATANIPRPPTESFVLPSPYSIVNSSVGVHVQSWQDIEEYCEVLKEKGAVYYENPADCSEVVRFGLWKTDRD